MVRSPRWHALSATLPPTVDPYLSPCLAKDSRQRVRDIGDVRAAFEAADRAGADVASRWPPGWQRPIPLTLAGLTLVFVGGLAA